MAGNREFSRERLAELILFFAKESEGDRYFGATKLNKLLFLADFWAYGYLGQSITGARYVHQQHGPTPAPSEFLDVRTALLEADRLAIVPERTYRGTRQRPVAKGGANETLFSEDELAICGDAIEHLCGMTASASERWSHDILAYDSTRMSEEIPYFTAFLWSKDFVTKDDVAWAMEVAGDLGLERSARPWTNAGRT